MGKKGPIPPLPPLTAAPETMTIARGNCAERCRDRGEMALAASYIDGRQDEGWNMRHEVNRLRTIGVAAHG
ncbi:hypothetical protein F1640_18530 [Novosphingobium sp. NBM11]|uniref:hypothetical protein n=1 Tax=Novosphingobium sp. NBM11 TaxID=2596914 RepID=UPI0018920F36|nr:hypothetical protein [Novosphingobium sp. NBM11]MBF5091953.1 hypothetical protein [Novosphingobium sp. NBM11]